MLIKCPECGLQVSDKAISCPHCGYPLRSTTYSQSYKNKQSKRRRLPNGFGQISKINNGNLRRQYRAMVTVGKTEEGKPICKLLKPTAYFSTYNEAYEALVEYNKNPYDLSPGITAQELFTRWIEERQNRKSHSYLTLLHATWMYCSSIHNMTVKQIRVRHIKECIENAYKLETQGKNKGEKKYATPVVKRRIKSMFNLLFDYALEYELVDKNYARSFELSPELVKEITENKKDHIPFTEDELNKLWNVVGKVNYVDWIIIQCYTGWRPQELVSIALKDVYLEEKYIMSGMKTEAGKQRIVPIHSRIYGLIKQNYDYAKSIGSDQLFNDRWKTRGDSLNITYNKYRNRFNAVVKQLKLNPNHRPHDPRVTFITRGKKAGMDEYALKEMAGHTIQDITESVYTIRDVDWLRSDLEKMV